MVRAPKDTLVPDAARSPRKALSRCEVVYNKNLEKARYIQSLSSLISEERICSKDECAHRFRSPLSLTLVMFFRVTRQDRNVALYCVARSAYPLEINRKYR